MPEPSIEKPKDKPTEPRLVDQPMTYILMPNSLHEERIGRAYVEAKYGKDLRAKIVTAIPVARLTEQNTLLVVARERFKPVTRRQPDPSGYPHDYEVPIEELILDVVEREPVKVSKFWLAGDEMGGRLNMNDFIEHLNKISGPFNVRFRGDEGLIRLFFL